MKLRFSDATPDDAPAIASLRNAGAGALTGARKWVTMTDTSTYATRHRDWIAAVDGTDIDAYADLVTEDLVWIPPLGDAVVGRAAFRRWLRPFFEAFAYEFSLDGIEAHEADRWIAEMGEFASRMTPLAGGTPATHSGRYFALWRREGDVWRIERYVDLGSLGA